MSACCSEYPFCKCSISDNSGKGALQEVLKEFRQDNEVQTVINNQAVEFVPPPLRIPPEKILEMRKYATELMRKYPHMKPARVQKKVAEYFKIKIVNEAVSSENTTVQD